MNWAALGEAAKIRVLKNVRIANPRDLERLLTSSPEIRELLLALFDGAGLRNVRNLYRASSSTLRFLDKMVDFYGGLVQAVSFDPAWHVGLENLDFSLGSAVLLVTRGEPVREVTDAHTVLSWPERAYPQPALSARARYWYFQEDGAAAAEVLFRARAENGKAIQLAFSLQLRRGEIRPRALVLETRASSDQVLKGPRDWRLDDLALTQWTPRDPNHVHLLQMYGTLLCAWLLVDSAADPVAGRMPEAYAALIKEQRRLISAYVRGLFRLYKQELRDGPPALEDYLHFTSGTTPAGPVDVLAKYARPVRLVEMGAWLRDRGLVEIPSAPDVFPTMPIPIRLMQQPEREGVHWASLPPDLRRKIFGAVEVAAPRDLVPLMKMATGNVELGDQSKTSNEQVARRIDGDVLYSVIGFPEYDDDIHQLAASPTMRVIYDMIETFRRPFANRAPFEPATARPIIPNARQLKILADQLLESALDQPLEPGQVSRMVAIKLFREEPTAYEAGYYFVPGAAFDVHFGMRMAESVQADALRCLLRLRSLDGRPVADCSVNMHEAASDDPGYTIDASFGEDPNTTQYGFEDNDLFGQLRAYMVSASLFLVFYFAKHRALQRNPAFRAFLGERKSAYYALVRNLYRLYKWSALAGAPNAQEYEAALRPLRSGPDDGGEDPLGPHLYKEMHGYVPVQREPPTLATLISDAAVLDNL